ncbi:MAG: YgaP family membrane protein [Rubricella sp.]
MTIAKNVGSIDRILRIVVGIALLSLVVVGPQSLWGLIGIVPLVTGLFSFCPLYSLIGVKTCRAS